MRKSLAALLVGSGILIGYAAHALPVSAQRANVEFLPFTPGTVVRLQVDLPDGMRLCTVSQVLNGFIGCAATDRQRASWINLRHVQEITPAPER